MDIILDYNGEQFIVELKLWHGDKYKENAYEQLLDDMVGKDASTGYLLTFDFRKGQKNSPAHSGWSLVANGFLMWWCDVFDKLHKGPQVCTVIVGTAPQRSTVGSSSGGGGGERLGAKLKGRTYGLNG